MRGLRTFGFVAATALALAACKGEAPRPAPAETGEAGTAVHPESGLEIIPLSIATDERTYGFRVELAASEAAQSKGLMFRTALGEDEGMLFPSDIPTPRSFWMKNTPLPLDIIFIAPDRTILNIAAETVPYSTESVLSDGMTIAVLELAGGRAEALGIEPGDTVEW